MFNLFEVLIFGIVLSADSFSAAFALGNRPSSSKDTLKFAFSSGGAEALTTLIGYLAGGQIVKKFGDFDHWIAFFLLLGVAFHMAKEAIEEIRGKSAPKINFHSFTKILIVSFATSLDALGVGISLGVSHRPIIPFITSIGLFAFLATLAGLYFAKKISKKIGPYMTLLGSAILGVLAFQMLKI